MEQPNKSPHASAQKNILFAPIDKYSYLILAECCLSKNSVFTIGKLYELHEFLTEGISFVIVKLIDVSLEGDILYFTCAKARTGVILLRSIKISNGFQPCKWLLVSLDYFDEPFTEEKLEAFCSGELPE